MRRSPDRGTGGAVLYLVATPIGNLEDITLRALRVLREADIIACEDTRHTRILLERYEIRTPCMSYYGVREKGKAREVMRSLKQGRKVALVTDAGTPGISDPGEVIVREAIAAGVKIVPVPGPSSVIAALSASGLPTGHFVFEGFLPKKRAERRKRLLELSDDRRTIILYESPVRARDTLREVLNIMGDRRAVLVRELTKIHETFERGTVAGILERLGGEAPKGEIVIVICGAESPVEWSRIDVAACIRDLQERMGLERKEAIRLVAQMSGIARSALYRASLGKKAGRQSSPQISR